jgi:hypothetical protein
LTGTEGMLYSKPQAEFQISFFENGAGTCTFHVAEDSG